MNIRKTREKDLNEILRIYESARQYMRAKGNPDQWGTTYPEEELLREDIKIGRSYVLEYEDGIHGVFMFVVGDDPTYHVIEEGNWLDDEPYGVIHRIASDGKAEGVLRESLKYCFGLHPNIRIDTSYDNHIMQNLLESEGFTRCGRIYIDDGSPRIAYQKKED